MRCLGCGYSLERLSTRRCPECGQVFDASDDRTDRCFRVSRRYVWIAIACMGYAALLLILLLSAVIARIMDAATLVGLTRSAFWLLACGAPLVVIVHIGALIVAPLRARHARGRLWPLWWASLAAGLATWLAVPVLLVFSLWALML